MSFCAKLPFRRVQRRLLIGSIYVSFFTNSLFSLRRAPLKLIHTQIREHLNTRYTPFARPVWTHRFCIFV